MKLMFLALPVVLGLSVAPQTGAPAVPTGDQWLAKPVDDKTFNTYLEFFTYDRQLPLDVKVTKVDQDQGVRRERLSFQSTPGVRVTGILFQGSSASGAKPPGLILLHGGGPQGKDTAGVIQTAALFSRAGWSVLSIDLPYFGERSTQLLTTFSDKEKHDHLYNQPSVYLAWVTQAVKDIRRGIDLMVEQRGVDPRRTGIVGASRGAIVATITAGVERRLSPVLLLFAGHFDALETNHQGAACPANYIGRIAPRPLLMVNGTQDSDMIKDRAVEPLFRLAKQPKQIIWTDGGHMFMTEENRASIIQWLREQDKSAR
jgi:pimeloyl-ACP methyl ester carboxylesterase